MQQTQTNLLPHLSPCIPLNVGQPRNANITLVGTGGTGSFLALHLARLAWHAREQDQLNIQLTFVDPDMVETKNVGRQDFRPRTVGWNKAEALARRYSLDFGMPIRFFKHKLRADHINQKHQYSDDWLHLVIGAVDNTAARRDIQAIVKRWQGRLWWLDCGNHHAHGQVLLGNLANLKTPKISPLGWCSGLPLPSVLHPELVQKKKKRLHTCADDTLVGEQSLMVNQQVAGFAASYVYRLLVTRDLASHATYFDLLAGSARSKKIS